MTAARYHYYYVKWADNIRSAKATSRHQACRLTFGMVADNMLVKDMGTAYIPLHRTTENWTNPDGEAAAASTTPPATEDK